MLTNSDIQLVIDELTALYRAKEAAGTLTPGDEAGFNDVIDELREEMRNGKAD